jgi:hypothetical protein
LQNNRDVDKNGLIIQMIASLNGLLNRMWGKERKREKKLKWVWVVI